MSADFATGILPMPNYTKKKVFKQALCGQIRRFFAKIPAERVPAAGGMREG
ncbi:MAG: hypothetical protein K2N31_06475 [Treponemataceae bacterium]|nr:hypothetical protein [Treponemataceae bacterium]MDE7227947.1 hypothetical protein [Treponemataceae bacterium]